MSTLSNADLAPTPPEARTWNVWHIASLWVGMSVCIPSYMLAAGMIQAGLTWRQALLAVLLGNLIVWVPLVVNAHAGTKYGIPFPVYARASFGTRGAHLPALLRALVACGWFGIQTWVGGMAIHVLLGLVWPGWNALGGGWSFMGHSLPAFLAFGLFWLVNLWFVWAGTEGIRRLETLAAPLLLAAGVALLLWATGRAGGLGTVLGGADALSAAEGTTGFSFPRFLPWVTAMVGYWATLSLNIPDFTRYARSQRDQAVGQAMGLLITMPLFAFIGVAVTSATVLLYGRAIWNPVELVALLAAEAGSPLLGIVAMLVIAVATLTTNIAANVVSPAFTFSNLAPGRITFRTGGVIAAVAGVLIFPWRLLDLYQGWLLSYSGLLGAVGGVILCDYLLVRRGRLDRDALYSEEGEYAYGGGGVNPRAMVALAAGVAVALAGLAFPALRFLFDGAWFSATLVSFGVYRTMMGTAPAAEPGVVPAGARLAGP
jgi:nucleobase:cation symporter-1, NCS1 family